MSGQGPFQNSYEDNLQVFFLNDRRWPDPLRSLTKSITRILQNVLVPRLFWHAA